MKYFCLKQLVILFNNLSQNITTITAHREASGYAPENTLVAIRLAVKMKADFSEIDVQETLNCE